jgi:hypothetical protein
MSTDRISCTNLQYWRDNIVIVFCLKNQTQTLIPVSIDLADPTPVKPAINIPNGYLIDECLQMLIRSDQLLILDNHRAENGSGNIQVFNLNIDNDTKAITITNSTTLNYAQFGFQNQLRIFGMSLHNTVTKDTLLLVVTLENIGLGYITYANGTWSNGSSVNLVNDANIQQYIFYNTIFLQLLVLDSVNDGNITVKTNVILSVSNGAHLQLTLTFTRNDTTDIYNSTAFEVTANYNNYKSRQVINWLDGLPPSNSIGGFGIMYYNTENNDITLAFYQLPTNSTN